MAGLDDYRVGAMAFDLEEGQSWDDRLTIDLTRQEAAQILAVMTSHGNDTFELAQAAGRDAQRGDYAAMLVYPTIREAALLTQRATRAIARVLLPRLVAQVEAEERAHDN